MDGWVDVNAVLWIAYSNQKDMVESGLRRWEKNYSRELLNKPKNKPNAKVENYITDPIDTTSNQ